MDDVITFRILLIISPPPPPCLHPSMYSSPLHSVVGHPSVSVVTFAVCLHYFMQWPPSKVSGGTRIHHTCSYSGWCGLLSRSLVKERQMTYSAWEQDKYHSFPTSVK